MTHLNAHHRYVFRKSFYPLALLAGLIAAFVAIHRTARTEILANHTFFDLTREQFALLATINLQVILWFLVSIGLLAVTILSFSLLHQVTVLHHRH